MKFCIKKLSPTSCTKNNPSNSILIIEMMKFRSELMGYYFKHENHQFKCCLYIDTLPTCHLSINIG